MPFTYAIIIKIVAYAFAKQLDFRRFNGILFIYY